MVSALDSGSNGMGSSPGWGTALCSWARHFTPIVPLSTQEYKCVPANLLLGVTLRWTIPSRGSRNTPSRFMLWKPGLKGGPSFWKLFKLDQTDPFNFGPRKQKSKSGEEKW